MSGNLGKKKECKLLHCIKVHVLAQVISQSEELKKWKRVP